jgi:hypothetical protein
VCFVHGRLLETLTHPKPSVGAAGSVERAVSGELFLIRLSDTIQDQIIIVDP